MKRLFLVGILFFGAILEAAGTEKRQEQFVTIQTKESNPSEGDVERRGRFTVSPVPVKEG